MPDARELVGELDAAEAARQEARKADRKAERARKAAKRAGQPRPLFREPAATRRDIAARLVGLVVELVHDQGRGAWEDRPATVERGLLVSVAVVQSGTVSDVAVLRVPGYFDVAYPLATVVSIKPAK